MVWSVEEVDKHEETKGGQRQQAAHGDMRTETLRGFHHAKIICVRRVRKNIIKISRNGTE